MALRVAQVEPEHSLFIDDREENVEGARAVGMNAAHLRDPADLEGLLRSHEIEF
jgi:FMN phosphatase YigB (HAD superfamily)